MKKTISERRLNAIQALAERGEDGEMANAIEMLERIKRPMPKIVYMDELPPFVDRRDIYIPYMEFVLRGQDNPLISQEIKTKEGETWKTICAKVIEAISPHVKDGLCFQNSLNKISCVCSQQTWYTLSHEVADLVYVWLVEMGVPVIHNGGDKAGFGCDTDEMEDGTIDGLFQYHGCMQYIAPNMEHEIKSAMQLPKFNKFVIITSNKVCWGAITKTTPKTITITPLNPKYKSRIIRRSDVVKIYRVAKGVGYYFPPKGKEDEHAAALARYDAMYKKA